MKYSAGERLPHNTHLTKYSQRLRCKPTDAERKLWSELRLKQLNGYQFYRQKVIGNYIVDFCSPALKLVIEVDGVNIIWIKESRRTK
jgi:very-short-patch-repair endonuclease